MKVLAVILLLSLSCFAQTDLSSTSATDSVPTNTGKSEALQANTNPLMVRHASDIARLDLTPTEFLEKFSVWKKASEAKGASHSDVFFSSSKVRSTASSGSGPSTVPSTSTPADQSEAEVESFLIAYKLSSELKLKFKDVLAARRTASSLTDALKLVATKENKVYLVPKVESMISEAAAQLK